jgi:hypothetical protein
MKTKNVIIYEENKKSYRVESTDGNITSILWTDTPNRQAGFFSSYCGNEFDILY